MSSVFVPAKNPIAMSRTSAPEASGHSCIADPSGLLLGLSCHRAVA